jgi:hypothetical protein
MQGTGSGGLLVLFEIKTTSSTYEHLNLTRSGGSIISEGCKAFLPLGSLRRRLRFLFLESLFPLSLELGLVAPIRTKHYFGYEPAWVGNYDHSFLTRSKPCSLLEGSIDPRTILRSPTTLFPSSTSHAHAFIVQNAALHDLFYPVRV